MSWKPGKSPERSGIVFSEDLCYEFRQLQQQVKAHPDVTDTWAWNSKIFAKSHDNKIIDTKYGSNWQDRLSATAENPVKENPSGPTDDHAIAASIHPGSYLWQLDSLPASLLSKL